MRHNQLATIAESGSCLTHVRVRFFDEERRLVDRIRFQFSRGENLLLSVDSSTDSMVVADGTDEDDGTLNDSSSEIWRNILGKPLLCGWQLENHRGYLDGCQFEFAESISESSVILQFIAGASMIQVFRVGVVRV